MKLRLLYKMAIEPEETSTYSAYMRKLNKENPDKVIEFMKYFKAAFDAALEEEIDDHQNVALLQAKQDAGSV